jgi:hypothetical protein
MRAGQKGGTRRSLAVGIPVAMKKNVDEGGDSNVAVIVF